jgi:hypothetical protein
VLIEHMMVAANLGQGTALETTKKLLRNGTGSGKVHMQCDSQESTRLLLKICLRHGEV